MRAFSQKELGPQVRDWVQAGLITDEQGGGILARYPATAPRRGPMAFILLGGLLCLGGIALLIASNWQKIPEPAKIGALLGLLAGSYAAGIAAQHSHRARVWWELGYLGAAVFPFLGLMLISQMFHLGGNPVTLLATWTLAIAPLPILTRSVSSFVVLLVAMLAVVFALPQGFGDPWWDFHTMALTVAGFGAGCAVLSQLWRPLGEPVLRNVGEYFGILTALLALYVLGFDGNGWFGVWLVVFVLSLGLIARGYHNERVHQVNLGFSMTGLVVLSVFLRLIGTMFDTGLIFIFGGLVLIAGVCALETVRRRLVARIITPTTP